MDRKYFLLAYNLFALVFMWMFVGFYPSIRDEADRFNELFEAYPQGMFEALGIENVVFTSMESFLALEYYSIIWPLLAVIMFIAFAGKSLAGEVEKGTAELILSKPVSRMKLFLARYGAGAAILIIFTFISVMSIVPLAAPYDIDLVIEAHWKVGFLSLLFGWSILSLSMMFSAMFSERSRAYMSVGGLFLVMYMITIASRMVEKAENLQYASLIYYFDYNQALMELVINWTSVAVYIAVAVISFVVGLLWFIRRDIAV